MFYEGINATVFRCSIAFAIVMSRSSSFEYTISVHAVHAGAERNACNIIVSTETPQSSSNPSQTMHPVYKQAHLPLPHPKSSPPRPPQPLAKPFAQMRYGCKYQVSSTGPNILEVYIIYLHVYMRQTVSTWKFWWNFKNAQANLSRGTCDKWQNLMYWNIYTCR